MAARLNLNHDREMDKHHYIRTKKKRLIFLKKDLIIDIEERQ